MCAFSIWYSDRSILAVNASQPSANKYARGLTVRSKRIGVEIAPANRHEIKVTQRRISNRNGKWEFWSSIVVPKEIRCSTRCAQCAYAQSKFNGIENVSGSIKRKAEWHAHRTPSDILLADLRWTSTQQRHRWDEWILYGDFILFCDIHGCSNETRPITIHQHEKGSKNTLISVLRV